MAREIHDVSLSFRPPGNGARLQEQSSHPSALNSYHSGHTFLFQALWEGREWMKSSEFKCDDDNPALGSPMVHYRKSYKEVGHSCPARQGES